MRLVVDTNVFVSAALKENSLPFLVARWIDRHDGLLKSAATEQQLLDVLSRPYITAATIPALREGLARILAVAELVPIAERITGCRDPTDDKFLEAGGERPCRFDRHRRRRPAGAESVPRYTDRDAGRLRAGRGAVARAALSVLGQRSMARAAMLTIKSM